MSDSLMNCGAYILKAQPVSIGGNVYGSVRLAAKAIGIDPETLQYRLTRRKYFPDHFYL